MTRTRFAHLRSEDGMAIVIAIVLMGLMLSMGMAAILLADSQSQLTPKQRQRETSFNVAEAALNAQITQISQHWAGDLPSGGFTPCPNGPYCPGSTELTSLVPSADTKTGIIWKTSVYDNSGSLSSYFADSLVNGQLAYDANGDRKMWVRAEATVRGHTRAVVSLVQEQLQAESVPHAAIITGTLSIDNQGGGGDATIDGTGGLIAVRCTVKKDGSETKGNACAGQPWGAPNVSDDERWNALLSTQIKGFDGHVEDYDPAPVFTQDQIYRFINTAKAEKTYLTQCPSDPSGLAGHVVVLDVAGGGGCDTFQPHGGVQEVNTQADPGFLMVLNATTKLEFRGNLTYYGVVYHANMGQPPLLGSAPQATDALITVGGNAQIVGGVIVDGWGRVVAGDSHKKNIQFDDHGYDSVSTLAGAGIIQNSWREIQPGA